MSTAAPEAPPSPATFSVEDRPRHDVDPSKVKPGDVMAVVQYVKVNKVRANFDVAVNLTDLDTGLTWDRSGAPLVARMLSADQVHETIAVPLTTLAAILVDSPGRPITVGWVTQKDADAHAKAGGKPKDAPVRTLRGRLVKHEVLLGRSLVEDLDIEGPKERLRLVDHRSLKFLIAAGVRYELKG